MIDRVFAGRYRVTEKIGIGGMAEVYKAIDETLGRTVAVKVMLPQYASDETFVIRFKQEAQAAANLQSPYIVNIYDWGFEETNQTYYIVMEYVRGTDLKTAITQRGAINQRKVAEIGAQVSAALGVAHSYDVIHRDIKPQNIMVQPDGNAKVMDFGIARSNNANMTQTGSVLGTAYYVSPEQAQGKGLTASTDIYSLGVVLYESITGRVPFDGPDAVSIAVKQVNEQPVPPRAIDSTIDPALEAIILKAMQKHPADRFTTAEEMRLALTEYLQGKPLSGVDPNARTRVAAPVVMPPSATTTVMPQLATAPTRTQTGNSREEEKSNSRTPLIVALVSVLAVLLIGVALYFAFCSGGGETGTIAVPDVVTMTEADAVKTIEAVEGLVVGEIKQQNSDSVPEGQVISQDPAARKMVKEGTKVNLVVSSGSGSVTVPDLSNMTPADARKALEDLKLVYEEGSTKPHATIEAGRVCAQNPSATSKVKEGSKVTVNLSSGKETSNIPNVIGSSQANAESTLTAAGFGVAYAESQYSSSVPEGHVIDQSPVGGEGKPGDIITLTLSKGQKPVDPPTPTKVNVPNIYGMDVNAASNALAAVGLVLDYTGEPVGRVATQTPAAGSQVDSGSKVTVTFVE